MRRAIAVPVAVGALLLTTPLYAQVGSMRVTVPSPTAASLGKFGDITVSLYTGVPDISIPLFTARGRTLELPIALRYHPGGIRVEEIGGWAGIGWTLDAGGSITRTVRGVVDEYGEGYYNTGHQLYDVGNWPVPSGTWLQNLSDEMVDGEPDQFFFSFAGRSGEIVIGPTTATSVKQYHAIPHQNWLIQPTVGFEGITSWIITTDDGTRYTFGVTETNTDYSLPTDGSIPRHYGRSYPSAWHLTSIAAPSGDVISLEYASYSVRHRLSTYYEKFDQVQSLGSDPCRPDHYGTVNEYEIAGARLYRITTAAHTISFDVTLRTDALSPSGVQQEPRLDRITVATPSGTVLRRFQLEHDYSTGRLTLKQVYEQDRDGASLPPFSLTYDPKVLPALTSYAQDHWGFYNGRTTNNTAVPISVTPEGYVIPGADREPDATFARAGVLTRITYPTGGYNEFVYEGNDYGGVSNYGSLPVGYVSAQTASARSWEGDGRVPFTIGGTESTIVKVITSQSPGDCGVQIDPPCPYTGIEGVASGWNDSYAIHYLTLAPGTYTLVADDRGLYPDGWAVIEIEWRDLGPLPKKPGGGLRVAEIRAVDAMGNLTVRKYRYTLQSDPARSSGLVNAEPRYTYKFQSNVCSFFSRSSMSKMPLGGGPAVAYREVTVWHGPNGEFGTTRHAFRSIADAADPESVAPWPFLRRTDLSWMRGQSRETAETNAASQLQQRVVSEYGFPNRARFQAMSVYYLSVGTAGSLEQPVGVYYYNPIEVFSSWVQQSAETTTLHDETGGSSIATAKTFAYANPIHGQPTEITETNSDGTQRITRLKYPADYAQGSGNAEAAALTAMQTTAHIHNAVVERVVLEKSGTTAKIVQAELTTFKLFGTNQYLPYKRFILNSPGAIP